MGPRPSYLGLDLTRPILRPTERTPRTTFSCMRLKHMAEKVGRREVLIYETLPESYFYEGEFLAYKQAYHRRTM
jgi:hypothetical protein